jgi:hypothetical protein
MCTAEDGFAVFCSFFVRHFLFPGGDCKSMYQVNSTAIVNVVFAIDFALFKNYIYLM